MLKLNKGLVWSLSIVALIAIVVSLYGIFVVLPIVPLTQTGFSQKIFYWHMPAAIVSFIAFITTLVYSVLFLIKKDYKYDMYAYSSAGLGLVFGVVLMIFGVIWDKMAWGVWWTWEPRLVTYLILLLLFGAYFFLRSMVSDREKKATYAAVFGIIAALDVPISFFSTRVIRNVVHPVIFERGNIGLGSTGIMYLIIAFVGYLALFIVMLVMKVRLETVNEELHDIKDAIEDRRE